MAQDQNQNIEITSDNAILLLAAAENLGLDASVVETTSDGSGFRAPQEVIDKAGLSKKAEKKAEKKADEPKTEKKAAKKATPRKQAPAKKSAPAQKAAAPKAAATEQK